MKTDLAEKTSDLKQVTREKQRLENRVKEFEDKVSITEKELASVKEGS